MIQSPVPTVRYLYPVPESLAVGHPLPLISLQACQGSHTLLRTIIPKGTVFEPLTQWDIKKCVNHINSYVREDLGGKTLYQLSLDKFGPEILRALQLKPIAPDDVVLSPKLLK